MINLSTFSLTVFPARLASFMTGSNSLLHSLISRGYCLLMVNWRFCERLGAARSTLSLSCLLSNLATMALGFPLSLGRSLCTASNWILSASSISSSAFRNCFNTFSLLFSGRSSFIPPFKERMYLSIRCTSQNTCFPYFVALRQNSFHRNIARACCQKCPCQVRTSNTMVY